MDKMKKKLNKKGFTLAELLIVVAIIAVLVAVSVPIFSSKLEKAREATDVANMRAAKAAAVSLYLEGDITTETTYSYDADAGKLVTEAASTIDAYGQGTSTSGGVTYDEYDQGKDYRTEVIQVKITPEKSGTDTTKSEPEIVVTWAAGKK